MRSKTTAGAMALAAALLALPAAADWLVTRDGGRVETRGSWQVKGKQVVFTGADGRLASLRLTDVDLEASERATREAAVAALRAAEIPVEAPAKEKKEARWVLTEKDFRQAAPAAPAAGEAKDQAAGAAAGRRSPVILQTWERRDLPERKGVEIVGTLRNTVNEVAADAGVTVRLFDEAGGLLATAEGRLPGPGIAPGSTVEFRAAFPGVYAFSEVKFDVRGFGLRVRAPSEAAKDNESSSSPGSAGPLPGRAP